MEANICLTQHLKVNCYKHMFLMRVNKLGEICHLVFHPGPSGISGRESYYDLFRDPN